MTKIKANQLEIVEILNDPLAQATETRNGTLEIATQAEVNGGSPYDNTLAITPQTLAGFSGIPIINNWLIANNSSDFSPVPQATGSNAIAIGANSRANATRDIAIGDGANTGSFGVSNIAVGYNATVQTSVSNCIVLGEFSKGQQAEQVCIGHSMISTATTADASHSVKIGYGPAGPDRNFLHLFDSGKLELYGEAAQFVMPNWTTAEISSLGTAIGGVVFDETTSTLKFHNSTAWTELNSYNWLAAHSGVDFTTTPTALFSNAIALGNNASATAAESIAIGTNVTASVNSVSLGINSDTLGSSSIAIGSGAQSGTGAEGATIAIGLDSSSVLGSQVSVGNGVTASSITPTDVQFSTKIGYGVADVNKNMLHLFSKGKLELYGDEAQFIMPNYSVTGSPIVVPATAVEGGVIYDDIAKGLQVYNGTSWAAVGGGITDIVEDITPQLGGNLDVNGKSIVSVGAVSVQINAGGDFSATAGTSADGKFAKIEGGLGGGYAAITGGYSDAGTGGTGGVAKVVGGAGYTNGGTVRLQGGYGEYGTAGPIALTPGYSGTGNDVGVVLIEGSSGSGYSTEVRFNEGITNGTGYVALKAPDSITVANRTWTLPVDAPADVDGQFMKTNSTGDLSFADPSLLGLTSSAATTYTLILTDGNNLVSMTSGSANTLTIPTNAAVAFPIGTQILVEQNGAGTTTIDAVGSPSVPTINSAGSLFDTASQYTTITLIKKAADTWLIVGDLV